MKLYVALKTRYRGECCYAILLSVSTMAHDLTKEELELPVDLSPLTYLRELARGERREVLPITVALPVGTVVRPVADDSVLLELPHHQNLRILDGHNRISMLIERYPDMQFVAVIPYVEPTLCDQPPSTPVQASWQAQENECYRLFDAVAPTEPTRS